MMSTLTPAAGALSTPQLTDKDYGSDPLLQYVNPNWSDSPSSIISPPDSKYIYEFGRGTEIYVNGIAELMPTGIWVYSISPTDGTLKVLPADDPFAPQTSFYNPTGITMDGLGKYLYVSDYSLLSGSSVDTTGLLKEFTILPDTGGLREGPIVSTKPSVYFSIQAADPAGKYLYGWFNDTLGDLAISVFAIDSSTGTPTEISGSPFLVETASSNWPWGTGLIQFGGLGMALSPSGQYLYASVSSATVSPTTGELQQSSAIYAFAVGPTTGALTPVPGSPVSIGDNTYGHWLAVHPNGEFLYALIQLSTGTGPINSISVYPIDATSGAILSVPASSVVNTTCCYDLLIDPTGEMLLTEGEGGWSTYTVDSSTGSLTAIGSMNPSDGHGTAVIVQFP
jgi:6-phosphogluconolactonase (cycloisomerase 2 family)